MNITQRIVFFVRIILVTTILLQPVSVPLSAAAARQDMPLSAVAATGDTSQSARQQVEALRQRAEETDEIYLERISAAQPELVQNAAMVAVQEALNGNLSDNQTLESVVIDQIDGVIDDTLADPNLGALADPNADGDGGFDPAGAYNWGTSTLSPDGAVNGAWAMQANLDDDVDPAAFEAAFEEQLAARSEATEAQPASAEPAAADPAFAPQPIETNTAAPQPFDPFAEPVNAPQTVAPAAPSETTRPMQTEDSALPTDDQAVPTDAGGFTEPPTFTPAEGDPPAAPIVVQTAPLTMTVDGKTIELPLVVDAAERPARQPEDVEDLPLTAKPPLTMPERVPENSNSTTTSPSSNCPIYVNANAPGYGGGWGSAFNNLDGAFQELRYRCNGSGQIYIAAGTYAVSGEIPVYEGVEIFGGYNAADGSRDWLANPTILNGSIIFKVDPDTYNSNSNVSSQNVLDGVFVRGTSNVGTGTSCLMEEYSSRCYLTLRHSVVEQFDTGIHLSSGSYSFADRMYLSIQNVIIRNNTTGILMEQDGVSYTIDTAEIHNNTTGIKSTSGPGGDIYWTTFHNNTRAIHQTGEYTNLSVYGSSFINNGTMAAGHQGGAIYSTAIMYIFSSLFASNHADQGGAIYFNERDANIRHVTFANNHARQGGAIYGSPTINASIFDSNTASDQGNAIYGDPFAHPSGSGGIINLDFIQIGPGG